ncbi:hypothetical protein [Klenkia brasiliensis]|uniref:DUF5642 domain-containing protein n=1 Tax=Klenkia brasiliensis TaxID=333142 RepID=A0A1G7T8P5_9ACTN|nr:hypothetical protein [Klenkia brasiliensis]SDG31676.1 hypothetical protein SAMN05660324_2361 [Klenkia brasiliensis]
MLSPRRPLLVLAAALAVAGCSSTVEGTASPAPTTGSPSSSAPSSSDPAPGGGDDLTAGLLPEDAFGAGAVVAPVSQSDLEAGAALGADLEGATITPESCAQAIAESQPSVADLTGVAAQTATSGTTVVAQLLSTGTPGDPVAELAGAATACPQATITSPQIGTATITLSALQVPPLGDGAAGLAYTTTVTAPDGSQIAVPALYAVVVDGDRLLSMISTSIGGSVDQAAFTALVQQAYEYQAEQLD